MTVNSAIPDNGIRRELDRRLNILADPSYEDPARKDISGWELGIWFTVMGGILLCAIAMWSGGS